MGSVVPQISTTLAAEVSGQIKRIHYEQGETVRLNAVLADVDDQTYLAELNRMKQERDSLQAQLKQRKDLYERTDRLLKKDAATVVEWQKANSDYLSILAQFEAANENVNALTVRFDKTKITAPYDGIIGRKMIDEGDFVSPGSPLFLMYTTGPMDIDFYVPERTISHIQIGDQVDVAIEVGGYQTTATISQITPYEDTSSRTFHIKARLTKYDSVLVGSFVRVKLPIGETQAITLPIQAIQRVGQLEMVDVLDGELWSRRYVRTGDQVAGLIEITSGLNGGEIVGYD
jgi:RND family efflux transporter MFP subunit